ncbi:6-phosphofructo-2-kinase-domain-containing protein [Haematococcus lacustris]
MRTPHKLSGSALPQIHLCKTPPPEAAGPLPGPTVAPPMDPLTMLPARGSMGAAPDSPKSHVTDCSTATALTEAHSDITQSFFTGSNLSLGGLMLGLQPGLSRAPSSLPPPPAAGGPAVSVGTGKASPAPTLLRTGPVLSAFHPASLDPAAGVMGGAGGGLWGHSLAVGTLGGIPEATPARPMAAGSAHAHMLTPTSITRISSQAQGLSSHPSGPCISKQLSKLLTTTVNFRDVNFVTSEVPASVDDLVGLEQSLSHASQPQPPVQRTKLSTGVQKSKLVIILVGLPARGKTFLCNKLLRYLCWLGHSTRHFNVGQYRRRQKGEAELQDATFFDHSNPAGREARQRALEAAMDDMTRWLDSEEGQVAIFDATNSTEERRTYLRSHFHGRWQYLFIESICNDQEVLERNYMNKMKYSPDYHNVPVAQASHLGKSKLDVGDLALEDFRNRIHKYEEVYESITDRRYHFIKLIDMVTGRGHMDINRISGYIPGKLVFFLMQVCKVSLSTVRKIWLTRHGQSEYNKSEKLGGDSSISEAGERYAELLPACLLSRLPAEVEQVSLSVWTSTLKRTIQTARMLPFPKLQWKALDEIDAGVCDGMTYKQIAREMPEEFAARKQDKLRYRYPAGESYLDVVQRLEPVITEIERERECVVIVSHQAVLRAVLGYFMGVPLDDIPSLEIPLHTLIELTPMPDGTMAEQRFRVDIHRGVEQFESIAVGTPIAATGISPPTPRPPPSPAAKPGCEGGQPTASPTAGLGPAGLAPAGEEEAAAAAAPGTPGVKIGRPQGLSSAVAAVATALARPPACAAPGLGPSSGQPSGGPGSSAASAGAAAAGLAGEGGVGAGLLASQCRSSSGGGAALPGVGAAGPLGGLLGGPAASQPGLSLALKADIAA